MTHCWLCILCNCSPVSIWEIKWWGVVPWVKCSRGKDRFEKSVAFLTFRYPFDYSERSFSCGHLDWTNQSSQSELAAGPILLKEVKACHDGEDESVHWAENGPKKLIARMEARAKYVHPLINLIVFMGQRVHISAACIMRAWNKVIHCIPFTIMWV